MLDSITCYKKGPSGPYICAQRRHNRGPYINEVEAKQASGGTEDRELEIRGLAIGGGPPQIHNIDAVFAA